MSNELDKAFNASSLFALFVWEKTNSIGRNVNKMYVQDTTCTSSDRKGNFIHDFNVQNVMIQKFQILSIFSRD